MYDELLNGTSCAPLIGTQQSLDCLRTISFDEINASLNATNFSTQRFPPSFDGDFIREYPSVQIDQGLIPHIPILIGQNTDEGTSFGTRGINTDEEMASIISERLIPEWVEHSSGKKAEELIAELMVLYPNDQSTGIPSKETWNGTIEEGTELAETLGLQFRRSAALFGDV